MLRGVDCASCPHCLPTRNEDPGNSPAVPHQWWLCYASGQNDATLLVLSLIAKRKMSAFAVLPWCIFFFPPATMPGLTCLVFLPGTKEWEHKTNYGLVPAVCHGQAKEKTSWNGCPLPLFSWGKAHVAAFPLSSLQFCRFLLSTYYLWGLVLGLLSEKWDPLSLKESIRWVGGWRRSRVHGR